MASLRFGALSTQNHRKCEQLISFPDQRSVNKNPLLTDVYIELARFNREANFETMGSPSH